MTQLAQGSGQNPKVGGGATQPGLINPDKASNAMTDTLGLVALFVAAIAVLVVLLKRMGKK